MKETIHLYGFHLTKKQKKKVVKAKKKWRMSESGVIRHLIDTYT